MPTPPLPDVPCVRVRLDMNNGGGLEWGNRFYLSYSGSAPSPANCVTLAGEIASAWATDLAPVINEDTALVEVDVLDIATTSGSSGQWTGTHDGSRSGTALPFQCATNIEYNIARRYRGGKPRMYLPPGVEGDQADGSHWSNTFIGDVNTAFTAFMAAIEALSVGSMGTLAHVNLSFYQGFTNFTTPSGRERAVPKYRATALHDVVESYATKAVIGSQRRRRTSTTF